jgi:branched-chain amino acid aminotransferase
MSTHQPTLWIDGQFKTKETAVVSVYDHGLLYGDGVFEGIRLYNGNIFKNAEHLRRLYDSARSIRLDIPLPIDQMKSVLHECVQNYIKTNNLKDAYIRLVVTRGAGDLGIDPRKSAKPSVIIIIDKINIYPPETYQKGMAVITSSVIRNHPNACPPRIKSLNYLNNILAKIEANDAGVPEAIMLNHNGNVAECTADNVFIIRGGQVQTPGTSEGILEGVTRQTVIELCAKHDIPLVEKTLQRHDLYIADECFLTGTGAEVVPVTKIDGRLVGTGEPGPFTRKIAKAYMEMVRTVVPA